MASENNDKPSSVYIKAEAELRYAEAQKHIRAAMGHTGNSAALRALASQTQFAFGRVLDALATICHNQEVILEQLARIETKASGGIAT